MQKDILLHYGNYFKLEPFKNYFKMVKINEVLDHEESILKEEVENFKNLKNYEF